MMYIIQITMMYTLNLYSIVCQLHLNKTGGGEYSLYTTSLGFPGDTSSKKPIRQCRRHKRHRFDPWLERYPGGRHGNLLQYYSLEIPLDRGAWQTIDEFSSVQSLCCVQLFASPCTWCTTITEPVL